MLLSNFSSGARKSYLSLIVTAFALLATSATYAEVAPFKRPKIAKSGPYVNSDILVSGDQHTVVPKHAVLFIPENMAHRKVSKPAGSFTIWPKFFSKNYGWIYKFEVTLEQASGEKPIPETKLKSLQSMGKVIVAVYKNGPISVLPPKTNN